MEKKDFEIVLDTLRHARDIIGYAARPNGGTDYYDFTDAQLRDMYYDINRMCCDIYNRMDAATK